MTRPLRNLFAVGGVVGSLLLVSMASGAPAAHAEARQLTGAAATACPSCATAEGGARVIDMYEYMLERAGGTAVYSAAAEAEAITAAAADYAAYAALNPGTGALAAGSTAEASASVMAGVGSIAEGAGLGGFLAGPATLTLPAVAAGATAFMAGYGIGTAGKWLFGKFFGGASAPSAIGVDTIDQRILYKIAAGGSFQGVNMTSAAVAEQVWLDPHIRKMYPRGAYQVTGRSSQASNNVIGGYCSGASGADIGWTSASSGFTTYANSITGARHWTIYVGNVGICSTSGTPNAPYINVWLIDAGKMSREPMKVGTLLPGGYTSTAAPSLPRSTVKRAIEDRLNEGDDTAVKTGQWIESRNDPTSTEPTTGAPRPGTLTLPAPNAHETYTAYVTRLRAAGLVGTITRTYLDTASADYDRAPGEAVRTRPGTGTTVAVEDGVEVFTNPWSMPPTAPGGGGGGSGGETVPDGGGGPTVPAIDLAPLSHLTPCDKFPFGVPCWAYAFVSDWSTSTTPPVFDWEVWNPVGEPFTIHIDLTWIDPAMDIARPLIATAAIIAMVWFFYGLALGTGAPAGRDDE